MVFTVIWVVLIFVSVFFFTVYILYRLRRNEYKLPHHQDDIYNISSRVQNQDQWPTHDAHVSLDHITIMNQMNKPVYDDAPPSYDEVMKTAPQNNGEASTASPPPPTPQVIVVAPISRTQ